MRASRRLVPVPAPVASARASPGERAESIGALLAQARVERGWSQLRLAEQLCAAAGVATVSRHEVSRWEREERVPGPFWLRWLAAVLEVPLPRLVAARPARRRLTPAGRSGTGAASVGA
jgi:transcriptional regulator with XRE-family HTH domain